MADIKIREEKIKEKRSHTPFRDFVKDICSRNPMGLYKVNGHLSRYPLSTRTPQLLSTLSFSEERETFTKYGMEYNFNKNFFDNFSVLYRQVPLPCLQQQIMLNEGADYSDMCGSVKNVYLSYLVAHAENVLYSMAVKGSCTYVLNSVAVRDVCENIYSSSLIVKSYNIFYSHTIDDCNNIRFCTDLIGCSECINSHNLKNQSYYIDDKQYDKETYFQMKSDRLNQLLKDKPIHKRTNATMHIENVENAFLVYNVHVGRNVVLTGGASLKEDYFDTFAAGGFKHYYGCCHPTNGENVYMSCHTVMSSSIYYSSNIDSCSFCLGCVGLKNKQFCIFNKQYSQEERFEKANEIFKQMEKDGLLGKFFPAFINPFYFNDTVAYLIDDTFVKEEVIEEGYLRRDEEIKTDIPANAEVIGTKDLANYQGFNSVGEREINKDILKKVIKDEKGNYYRIVPMELDFLQKHGLPLPEIHRLERIKLGFKFT